MICVSLSNMGFEECLVHAGQEPFVEFRFDQLDLTPDQVFEAVRSAGRSIATFRPGTGDADTDLRRRTLLRALEAGASYLDIELEAESVYRREMIRAARSCGSEIIISYHNFTGTPEFGSLRNLFRSCRKRGADVVKIACQVNDESDLWSLMGLYREGGRMAVIGMGEKGLITRIAAPFMGAEFTFAFPVTGRKTAPGQIDRNRLASLIENIRSSFSMENPA